MFDFSPFVITLIMFGSVILLLFIGAPLTFVLGGIGVMCLLLFWGPEKLIVVGISAWAIMDFFQLIAVPLFIFMAMILQLSGVADALFKSIRLWLGGTPGGLAMGVVFICTIIAAMTGVCSTGIVTMGVLALPLMLKLGYDKTLAIGPIMAGGSLGFLIPPSIAFIVYGVLAEVSIGKLFLGGIIPGFILSISYITYIGIRCRLNPKLGPPLPFEERASLIQKVSSLKSIFPPAALIMAVLGTIILGIASPTESASAGVIGAVICASINRRLNWQMVKDACYSTFTVTVMVMWIVLGAFIFKAVFIGVGGPVMVREFIGDLNVTPMIIIMIMQLSYLFLGCFMDEVAIMMITLPIYLPLVTGFGFDLTWFGVVFLVNMQIAYLTPPVGFSLIYFKGVAPPEVTMGDIYRSILPFLPMQLAVMALVMFFPQLALLLPELIL